MVYAVAKGKQPGIYSTWSSCKQQIHGHSRPVFRKFNTNEEAHVFMQSHGVMNYTHDAPQDDACDSETLDSFFTVKKTRKKKEKHDTTTCTPVSKSAPSFVQYIYTDGACAHNGKAYARAGAGVYFGDNDPRNRSERVHGKQSNNTGEITAVLLAYEQICKEWETCPTNKYVIVTDSLYTIHYATDWGEKQEQNGWTKSIPNKSLVQQLYYTFRDEQRVSFLHVKAHTHHTDRHSLGNAQADRLANLAISKPRFDTEQCIRNYVNVPFSQKEIAKQLGCKWDKKIKLWYYTHDVEQAHVIEKRFGFE